MWRNDQLDEVQAALKGASLSVGSVLEAVGLANLDLVDIELGPLGLHLKEAKRFMPTSRCLDAALAEFESLRQLGTTLDAAGAKEALFRTSRALGIIEFSLSRMKTIALGSYADAISQHHVLAHRGVRHMISRESVRMNLPAGLCGTATSEDAREEMPLCRECVRLVIEKSAIDEEGWRPGA